MFELRHLRVFLAIAEELHFGRAARRLHMTQPPLSQLLKQLESAMGEKLFERTTRSVELTPAGKALVERAREIVTAADGATLDVRRAASGDTGQLAFGFVSSASYQYLPHMIQAYRRAYPHVHLSFKEMVSSVQLEALRRNAIDIGLVRPTVIPREFESRLLWQEPFVVAVPASHRLAARKRIAVTELDGEPFITFGYDDSPYFSGKVEQLLAAHDTRPVVVQRSAIHTILAFVEAGIGLALVPASTRSVLPGHIRFLGLRVARPQEPVELYAIWARGRNSVLIENWIAATSNLPS